MLNETTKHVINFSKGISSFIEIAKYNAKCFSPTRADCLSHRTDKLGESAYFSGCFFSGLGLRLECLDLVLRQTQCSHPSGVHIAGHDLQISRHNIGTQPTLSQRTLEILSSCSRRATKLGESTHRLSNFNQAQLH